MPLNREKTARQPDIEDQLNMDNQRVTFMDSSILHKLSITAAVLVMLFLLVQCSLFQPDEETGAIQITVIRETEDGPLPKTAELMDHLQCILTLENTVVHSKTYYEEGGYFQIIIRGLKPAEAYSIVLWGYNQENELLGQGLSDNITVRPDDITTVTVEWQSFRLRLLSPGNGREFNVSTPTFRWTDIVNALSYQLELDSMITYASGAHQHITTENTSYTVDTLTDALYYWRVRCLDQYGNWTAWTPSNQVTIDTRGPNPPQLISPESGSTVNTSRIHFDWTEVTDALSYDLAVCRNDSFINVISYISTIYYSSVSYLSYVSNLEDGRYYWRVCSKDSLSNKGPWSPASYFTVDTTPPEPPELLLPADGDTIRTEYPAFTWEAASEDAVTHYFQIGSDSLCTRITFSARDLTSTECTHSSYPLLNNKTYYWRVCSSDSAGNASNWSAIRSFYTAF